MSLIAVPHAHQATAIRRDVCHKRAGRHLAVLMKPCRFLFWIPKVLQYAVMAWARLKATAFHQVPVFLWSRRMGWCGVAHLSTNQLKYHGVCVSTVRVIYLFVYSFDFPCFSSNVTILRQKHVDAIVHGQLN